jgi:hypothetical protein
MHVYEVRPRKDNAASIYSAIRCHSGGCGTTRQIMQSATQSATRWHSSRSHDPVIRAYDAAGNVIETHNTRAISKSGDALPILGGILATA